MMNSTVKDEETDCSIMTNCLVFTCVSWGRWMKRKGIPNDSESFAKRPFELACTVRGSGLRRTPIVYLASSSSSLASFEGTRKIDMNRLLAV